MVAIHLLVRDEDSRKVERMRDEKWQCLNGSTTAQKEEKRVTPIG